MILFAAVSLAEMKAGLEKGHQQELNEVKREMIKEKNKAVLATKKKQWVSVEQRIENK